MEKIVCLDSDVIIEFLRGNPKVSFRIRELEEKYDLATTAINVSEVVFGVIKKNSKELEKINTLLRKLTIFPITENTAGITAKIRLSLIKKGCESDHLDILIAAAVIENKAALFTLNTKHFEKVDELTLI